MHQHDPPPRHNGRHARGVWLMLNADGILLAGLAFFSGLDLFAPQYSDIAEDLGYIPPTFFLWTTCYLAAGVLMMTGFIWQKMGPELFGRLLLIFGFTIETWRAGSLIGWLHHDLIVNYAVGALVITICTMRAKALLNPKGLTIVIGGPR